MKKLKRLALVSILLLIGISCTSSIDWELYTKTNGYEILFPKKPMEATESAMSEIGELEMHTVSCSASYEGELGENPLYMVSRTIYPKDSLESDNPEIMDSFFKNIIDRTTQKLRGKLSSTEVIDLEGFTGKDVKISFTDKKLGGEHVMRLRLYLVENIFYLLQIITKVENDDNDDVEKFMNSFKLVEKKR